MKKTVFDIIISDKIGLWSQHNEPHEEYRGWLSTAEGPKMSDERLDEIQAKILSAVSNNG